MDERLNDAPCGFLSLDDAGAITEVNRTLCRLLGYSCQELEGQHVNVLLNPASRAFYQLYFFPMIRMHGRVEALYIALRAKSGQEMPILLNARRYEREGAQRNDCICFPMKERYEYEQALLTVKQETDERNRKKRKQIDELEKLQQELESKQRELIEVNNRLRQLAESDGLTGLRNRRSLQEHLSSVIPSTAERRLPVSLLLLDIDNFKCVNDTFGHMAGDRVLQEMGRLLTEESRPDDFAARYGGEEFAVVLPDTDSKGALYIAERIRRHVERTDWGAFPITISVGAATSIPGDTGTSILEDADLALYASKHAGRNRATHANDIMDV